MSRSSKPSPRPRRRPGGATPAASKGSVRVIAGDLRGRRFDVPAGTSTRPTSDRVREAVFNALDSLDAVASAVVLDAFAGSGALGIEALSRGAERCVFADTDPAAVSVVEGNLAGLGLSSRASVRRVPAARALDGDGSWDLVLLDPPYAFDDWDALLGDLAPHLADDAVVVIESGREIELPAPFVGIRSRVYSGTVVQFASIAGDPS